MHGIETIKRLNDLEYKKSQLEISKIFSIGIFSPLARHLSELPKTKGFTFRPSRFPEKGFMIGGAKIPSPIIKEEEKLVPEGMKFFRRNYYLLKQENICAGGWKDEETGLYHLDISQWKESLIEATLLGRIRDQLSIWDLSKKIIITL